MPGSRTEGGAPLSIEYRGPPGYRGVPSQLPASSRPEPGPGLHLPPQPRAAALRRLSPDREQEAKRISSRFHLDPRIPRETAHRIKARWAENYFTGERGDAMVVARRGSETAGFLQLLRGDAVLVIDLIAVDARHQRRNLASAMIIPLP